MELLAKTCNYGVMDAERIAARVFVGLGGALWFLAVAGAAAVYQGASLAGAVLQAALPLVLAVVALPVGWFYENAAAVLLFLGAVATIVWGIVVGWEPGVWALMAFILIAPEVISGVLFLMAAQMQRVCELTQAR